LSAKIHDVFCFLFKEQDYFTEIKNSRLGPFFLSSLTSNLQLLCGIRIIGAAIIIHDESKKNPISEAGLIISSVAVAPMIIAIGGIAHES
jgi:hypothetical protein